MDDYKSMFPPPPKKDDEQPKPNPWQDPIGAFPENPDWSSVRNAADPVKPAPEPAAPETPPPADTPYGGADDNDGIPVNTFGLPETEFSDQPDYGWQAPPVVPPEKPISMNRRIYTMCAVASILIFLLCVYCIGSDILHGALGAETPRQVTVDLQVQPKPDLDPDDADVNADGEYTVRGVAEKVTPSIVEVYTYRDASGLDSVLAGTGSGIILSKDGYIVTNSHVVQGEAFKVRVGDDTGTDQGKEYDAELVGSDPKTDLAVLKINAYGLTPAVLGDSSETYVGENVVAIGNPAGLTNTVTRGIVSAIGRQVRSENSSFKMECIQTDAAISPGNSGGALVNMYGQVIGITSSKYASMYSSTYEGLGFAISINEALPIVTDLMENGYVQGRFRIGIVLMPAGVEYAAEEFQKKYGKEMPQELKNSIWITEISDDCDISHTDLEPYDFILEMNGKPIHDYDSTIEALDGCEGGDEVTARCARYKNGEVSYFDIRFKLETDTSGNY